MPRTCALRLAPSKPLSQMIRERMASRPVVLGRTISPVGAAAFQHRAFRQARADFLGNCQNSHRSGIAVFSISGSIFGSGNRILGFACRTVQKHKLLISHADDHCPDVCPTTLNALAKAYQALPAKDRSKTRVLFVSCRSVTRSTRDSEKLHTFL